jgi:hypothetical protein
MPVNFKVIDNKKYMWDSKAYANENEARNTAAEHGKNGFDVQVIKDDGKFLIYTRRLAVVTTDR